MHIYHVYIYVKHNQFESLLNRRLQGDQLCNLVINLV